MSQETANLNFVSLCGLFFVLRRASFGLDCERARAAAQLFLFFKLRDVAFSHLLHMSVGQLARSFQAKAPVLCLQQHPDLFAVSMTRIPLIVSIGSAFFLGRAWTTSRVYRRAAALDSHRINHRRWFCAASIVTHTCSRRDRAIRIFNFPPKAATSVGATQYSFSFAAAFSSSRISGQSAKLPGRQLLLASTTFPNLRFDCFWQPNSLEHISCQDCTVSELAKESLASQPRRHI